MAPPHLPPLDQLDPTDAWQPWQPDAARPWNFKWAGHLYRRAGFGANLAELRAALRLGPTATLDRLLHGGPQAASWEELLTSLDEPLLSQTDPDRLRGGWLYSLLYSPWPLREKMTLFWHNHFATSIAKVGVAARMFRQQKTLRQHALGNFRRLLLAISRDPAMLVWLDSNSNVKGKPNENYARELMELFTLGVGHYTETDIREAARAFTGWHTNGDQFEFNAVFHDEGEKCVLGQKGIWDGADIVRIVLDQPAAAHFLVRKLYRFFISEAANPPSTLLEPLAEQLRSSDYDIAAIVQRMLGSRLFFSEYAYRQRIKSPVELVVGTVRTLVPDWHEPNLRLRQDTFLPALEAMGQQLFAPPNVKGWEGGRSWLNTATILARTNFVQQVLAPERLGRHLDASWQREHVTEAVAIVRVLTELFLQGDLRDAAQARLVTFVADGNPQGAALTERVRAAAHALLTMPEYQLA